MIIETLINAAVVTGSIKLLMVQKTNNKKKKTSNKATKINNKNTERDIKNIECKGYEKETPGDLKNTKRTIIDDSDIMV